MTYTADQIIGNRLKVLKPVTVFLGHPGASKTEIWKTGFLSPPIYSYVEEDDGLYWMIGELPPFRYVKQKTGNFKAVADEGGAKYLPGSGNNSSNGFLNSISGFFDFGVGNAGKIIKVTALVIFGLAGFKAYKFFT